MSDCGRWCAILTGFIGICALSTHSAALAQSGGADFDACGVLVRGTECTLFETGGARYLVVGDFSRFRVGDSVRVVGKLNPQCVTICSEGDGCIGDAEVFNPELFPCGTPIQVPFDPCSGISLSAAAALTAFGLRLASRPLRR
ncbi:MAG: hypothetical protein IPM64_12900 [Phycisphaerales bacterium]|nr:hypothetical protein [Phycisphaerales bacterium]